MKNINVKRLFVILIFSLLSVLKSTIFAQNATISEEIRSLKTYPFSEPNPIPILVKDARLYPYHTFEGYSHDSKIKDWKVVKLENDYIEVYILPEVGGKVWGAIEKSTGQEFIYRNEVMKFRNIALRGPWTSGGIEFNFGIIGHTPATATPVDYCLKENSDGSVSCIVGTIDLPSRTHWRVEINLPKDKAFFETKALWYNPSPVAQPYYNWMTAAAFASNDLELILPGNKYLKHSGEAKSWPYNEKGRKISMYKNNNYGSHKSYHVVGKHKNFFGGYFHDSKYGFGHLARYYDMPGQKMWLWALSRAGGIWEDLLTDTDGQYVEFQAGRQFLQYAPQNQNNPMKEVGFDPYSTDQWNEIWFPVKEIGGITKVSPKGIIHVFRSDDQLQIGINAFEKSKAILNLIVDGEVVLQQNIDLKPMGVYKTSVPINGIKDFKIEIPEMDLTYKSNNKSDELKRPYTTDKKAWTTVPETDRLLAVGKEYVEGRLYEKALKQFESVLDKYPWHHEALIAISDLYFRSAQYEKGLKYINKALQHDAYDPSANYTAGILYRSLGDLINAKEAFGWAARSMTFRSVANTQIAEIALQEKNFEDANFFAKRALDFNRYNINALQVIAISSRKVGNNDNLEKILEELLKIDPLHHFAYFEHFLLNKSDNTMENFKNILSNEFPDQIYLELAISYYNRNLIEEANQILEIGNENTKNPLIDLWLAFLNKNDTKVVQQYINSASKKSPAFVFPYRRETIKTLEWIIEKDNDWKWNYYLALNYWGKDRKQESTKLLQSVKDKPDFAQFYLSRAHLLSQNSDINIDKDLNQVLKLDKQKWNTWVYVTRHYQDSGQFSQALKHSSKAYKLFPDNFNIAIIYAKALLYSNNSAKVIKVLNGINVLPSEMARECRALYELAHIQNALNFIKNSKFEEAIDVLNKSKIWPENLGQGKPFDPDERMQDMLLGYIHQKQNNLETANMKFEKIILYTKDQIDNLYENSIQHYLGYILLDEQAKHKEAQELISKLSKGYIFDKKEVQWIIAKSKSSDTELKNFQQKYPNFYNQYDVKLISEILSLFNY